MELYLHCAYTVLWHDNYHGDLINLLTRKQPTVKQYEIYKLRDDDYDNTFWDLSQCTVIKVRKVSEKANASDSLGK